MKLAAAELLYIRSHGLYITEKCDACGKLLNQTVRYSLANTPGTYCSAICRDTTFFRSRHEAKKHATPGRCAYCGGSLNRKKRGSVFCDDACRKAHGRKTQRITTAEVEKSRTPIESNQRVTNVKIGQQGEGIRGDTQEVLSAAQIQAFEAGGQGGEG